MRILRWCIVTILFCMICRELTEAMSKNEKRHWRDKIIEMFRHGYSSYMTYAYPADELMPLSCKGRYRGSEPSRGDIDESLGNYSLTLIDTLDTLAVLGEVNEFESGVKRVIENVRFDTNVVVSVFEMNIRVIGGLLGAHILADNFKENGISMSWYKNELLTLATDAAERLLPAFNTTTGIPLPRINLKHGTKYLSNFKETCTACAGTMILEMAALSRLTGQRIFEEKAVRALDALWSLRHRGTDLMGTILNVHSGEWIRRDSGLGAGIDSYYEYLLKAYILLGEDKYLHRFSVHYAALKKHVHQSGKSLPVDVHMHKPESNAKAHVDALLAFWPGLQVLAGDVSSAIELHELLHQVTERHGFLPEAFTTDFRVHWAHHPLRPEFIESTYLLYEATNDPHYLRVGADMIRKIDEHTRVDCGFAAIKNVNTRVLDDQMDSFVLAETFKYLYLLFSEPEDLIVDPHKFLLTTEAHLLPLSTVMQKSPTNATFNLNYSQRTCPNSAFNVEKLRSPLRDIVQESCPRSGGDGRRRLEARQFSADNSNHLEELRKMGVKLVTMKDGRVQLVHSMVDADSPKQAQDGLLFMQEMIEMTKNSQDQGNLQEPRIVQFLSSPFLGHKVLNGGPAQFGKDLKELGQNGIEGELAKAEPYKGCSSLTNTKEVYNKIVIVERGACMFIDKARNLQAAGASGGIVIDDTPGSSRETSTLFAMSGDGKDDVTIPLIFLYHKEGEELTDILSKHSELKVMIAFTPKSTDSILERATADSSQDSGVKSVDGKPTDASTEVKHHLSIEEVKAELRYLISDIKDTELHSDDFAVRFTIDIINGHQQKVPEYNRDAISNAASDRLIEIISSKIHISPGTANILRTLVKAVCSGSAMELNAYESVVIRELKKMLDVYIEARDERNNNRGESLPDPPSNPQVIESTDEVEQIDIVEEISQKEDDSIVSEEMPNDNTAQNDETMQEEAIEKFDDRTSSDNRDEL
ncbi:DgyrCDS114 [Dimorphilus gyrociliatus]|uniref:alpha-1,2-Mannosidase n=1 Tax=Dimorphilus gyrociliatus TaxID=2664684 RepID=A0A7I8V6D6_9ANNE|nr:DgyrCDS114 [Dimorphilus gyrociliatus]